MDKQQGVDAMAALIQGIHDCVKNARESGLDSVEVLSGVGLAAGLFLHKYNPIAHEALIEIVVAAARETSGRKMDPDDWRPE